MTTQSRHIYCSFLYELLLIWAKNNFALVSDGVPDGVPDGLPGDKAGDANGFVRIPLSIIRLSAASKDHFEGQGRSSRSSRSSSSSSSSSSRVMKPTQFKPTQFKPTQFKPTQFKPTQRI
jgi:hypothetical protein